MTKVRTCPACSDKAAAGDVFCEGCGRPLPEDVGGAPAGRPEEAPTAPQQSMSGATRPGGDAAPAREPEAARTTGTHRFAGAAGAARRRSEAARATGTHAAAPGGDAGDARATGTHQRPAGTAGGAAARNGEAARPGLVSSDGGPTAPQVSLNGATGGPDDARVPPPPARTGGPSAPTDPGPSDAVPSDPGSPDAGRSLSASLTVDSDWDAIDSLATQPVRRDPVVPGPAPAPTGPPAVPAVAPPGPVSDWPPPAVGSGPVQPGDPRMCVWCPGRVSDGYCEQCGFLQPTGRDHVEVRTRSAVGVSDRGLRHRRNEDAMAIRVVPSDHPRAAGTVCAVVCDGVSSSPRSDEASRITAETGASVLAEQIRRGVDPREATGAAMTRAAEAVAGIAESLDSAPACTFVSAVVDPAAGTVTVGWVGDSRAYWLSGGPGSSASALLTRDDSWSEAMVQMGALSREEAMRSANAHALIAWMGADSGEIDAHISTVTPTGPGTVLLCSDGLWNYLPEARSLAEAAPDAASRPHEAARSYISLALRSGGKDNITAVLIPIPVPAGQGGQRAVQD